MYGVSHSSLAFTGHRTSSLTVRVMLVVIIDKKRSFKTWCGNSRLLQTLAGVLQKKICMRAVFKETPQTINQKEGYKL